ncbi:hypothetical protein D3C83_203910 [compost metagenome]
MSFSPDGRSVASASTDRTARVFTIDWEDLVSRLRDTTTTCLSAEQRRRYLAEEAERADASWRACERRFDRQP